MTAKEKAKELVDRFSEHARFWDCYNDEPLEENHAKQCALICVYELINSDWWFETLEASKESTKYWNEVQQEINKL